MAVDCQEFGADGITVHPRPDERHIRRADVYALRPIVRKEFNIEGYPDEEFMKLVLAVKPEQATLVPDAPGVLTSSAGWDVTGNFDFLQGIAERLRDAGIRTSIFVAPDAVQIAELNYLDTIELAYSGAQIIHPKTIKPLQNKGIPLFVRSFLYPESHGSVIRELDERLNLPPIFIDKGNQLLLTLTPRDFSFIAEEKLSGIFATLAKYRMRLNLMQTSAISFSFCIDLHEAVFRQFIEELHDEYEVLYNKNVRLLTIRHYTDDAIARMTEGKKILVEQRSRLTARFVVEE